MRVSDVDPFKKARARPSRCVARQGSDIEDRNAIREIPIPVEIVNALRAHIGNRTEGFIFTTKNGTPWNADLVLRRHLRGKLRVVDGHLQTFRHTLATRQLQAGVPITVMSKLLEYGTISTPLDIHARVSGRTFGAV